MKLGFVSAILPELSFQEVMEFAQETAFDCVEIMCWPVGKASRRYAGVTHIDINKFGKTHVKQIQEVTNSTGVAISGFGYYPNPLTPDKEEARIYINHIKKLIRAAAALGLDQVNTFIGRDWNKSVEDNWPQFKKVWQPIIKLAEQNQVRIGIENCPMLFTADEWPGGKNLATSPSIWRKMFEDIPSDYFGLNYDPSHMIWQRMDYLQPMKNFAHKLFHIHAKDVRINKELLNELGIMAYPNQYHSPKLPGLGEVNWGKFFSVLGDTGYRGPVCVEVEDRAYEGSLDERKAALRQSATYLRQFIPKR